MPRDPLPRVRKLALSLPEAHEVEAWGEPTFRVKNKIFAMYAHANNHHGGGKNAIWCKAKPINQRLMIDSAPDRSFHHLTLDRVDGSVCGSTAKSIGKTCRTSFATATV